MTQQKPEQRPAVAGGDGGRGEMVQTQGKVRAQKEMQLVSERGTEDVCHNCLLPQTDALSKTESLNERENDTEDKTASWKNQPMSVRQGAADGRLGSETG